MSQDKILFRSEQLNFLKKYAEYSETRRSDIENVPISHFKIRSLINFERGKIIREVHLEKVLCWLNLHLVDTELKQKLQGSHFSGLTKFQEFSRITRHIVIFQGFPGRMGTLKI